MSSADLAHPEASYGDAIARFGQGRMEVKLYVWDIVVRLCHWGVALSVFVLSFTGIYIGNPFFVVPGEAGEHFVMGTIRAIHFYAALVFAISVVTRVAWALVGRRRAGWRELIPVERERRVGILGTISFYLFARDQPPRSPGHNPLAGATYVLVFMLYGVILTTGLGLYVSHSDSFMGLFGPLAQLWGGEQSARWVHHVSMWLLLGFFVHHIASALLVATVKKNGTMESIFSGYKWVEPGEALREADRWAKRDRS